MLINLEGAIYRPAADDLEDLLARLRAAIPAINARTVLNLSPLDTADALALSSPQALDEGAGLVYLAYDEASPRDEHGQHVRLRIGEDDEQGLHIGLLPELAEVTRAQVDLLWVRFIEIAEAFCTELRPALAAINGLDDARDNTLPDGAKVRPGAPPPFFTPWTWLDASAMNEQTAAALREAGAFRVQRVGSGWSLQIVESLYVKPPEAVRSLLAEICGGRGPIYRQTRPPAD